MGLSSSLLDENKFNFIKSWAETELRNFSSIYKKQYSLAFLSHVHDELVQRKQEHTQLLKQQDSPHEAEVVYQETVLHFCLNRKWKKRFVVVRANYSLECHESYEIFMKGIPPLNMLSTTGGTILTTEEKYMEIVDRCFLDTDNVKEDFAPPVVGMPGQFPVYLRLPYKRDYYFCFFQETNQATFISVLSDCIRHQNQDFLKNKTYEVQAFIKAIQLYRQEKGYYEAWDMLIGNDVQVLANLTMEGLMPALERDFLARLKAKKMDKKRLWFATVEAVYNLVQETLTEGMAPLNDECREATMHQSALMRSDMDQIISSRAFLESKLRATVAELATEYCKQHVEPRLPAVLEGMMGPISMGFAEARQVSESMMEHLCKKYQAGLTREELQQALVEMSKPNLQSCYEKVRDLRDHIHEFSYPDCRGLEHSTQIDIQQLVDSVSYTFGLLLNKSPEDNSNLLNAMIKAKQRVLKQYDYDSSTLRKKIFQGALISIMLPSFRAFLAPTFKKELPDFQQYIFDDYVNFINVENVYEDILQETLNRDISKVVNEAASMKKYDLHIESRYRFSVSTRYITPPDSPDYTSSFTTVDSALPSSPLLSPSLTETQGTGEGPGIAEKKVEQEADREHAQAELIKVCPSEDMVEHDIIMAQQDDVQAQAQLALIRGPDGEDLVVAELKVEPEIIIQAHEQPDLITVPAGEDPIVAEKKVEEVIIQAQVQPELIKVPADEDLSMAKKKKEELEVIVQPQAQPDISKIVPGNYSIIAEKKVEQEVEVQVHAQPDLINGCPGENTIVPEEKVVEQELFFQAQAEPELEVSTSVKVKAEHKMEDNGVQSVPVTVHTALVEKTFVTVQSLEEKTYSGSPNVAAINTDTLLDMFSSSNTEPAAHIQTEPNLKPLDTAVQASLSASPTPPVQASSSASPTPPVQASPPGQASPLASPTPPVQASSSASPTPPVQASPPGQASPLASPTPPVLASPPGQASPLASPTPPVLASPPGQASPLASPTPPVLASPPGQAGPSASPTPPDQLSPPAQASLSASPTPPVQVSPPVKASPLDGASPPEGDTGSICPNLKCVSSDSEAESAAKIRRSSAKESTPNIQPPVIEVQTSNTTRDTDVAVDDLTSLQPIIYEVRVSNDDDSSWTTEEEGDSIEEDDPTTETTAAVPIPEDCDIVKSETMLETSANVTENPADPKTKATRPLDCIREIRELVVEVIQVEEVPQHYLDD